MEDDRISDGLRRALAVVTPHSELAPLNAALTAAHDALARPMRVAIVGLIKAGKSTLLNALLGDRLLPVGISETTFTVNSLVWAERPTLKIHFKGGRPVEERPFSELERFVRRSDDLTLLQQISLVEIGLPRKILQRMSLIDTPGLASTYIDDSENTRAFLNLHGSEITAATEREAERADAVLYVFSKSLHESDQAVLAELQGATLGRATPLNSIGVLSKIDLYWPDAEPIDGGKRVARRLADHPRSRRLLYDVLPVGALAAEGAQRMSADERAVLLTLAEMPTASLRSLLGNDERFVRDDPQLPSAALREQLLDHLGAWGIWVACGVLKGAPDADLASEFARRTGLGNLQELVFNHFGNRARIIKLNSALPKLKSALFKLRRTSPVKPVSDAIAAVGKIIEDLELGEPAFVELAVLQDYYAGHLDFDTNEVGQFLSVTGEYGTSTAARLGAAESSPTALLREVAETRLRHWHAVAAGADGRPNATRSAARIIARRFEAVAACIV